MKARIAALKIIAKMIARQQQRINGIKITKVALPLVVCCMCFKPIIASTRPQTAPTVDPQNGTIAKIAGPLQYAMVRNVAS